MEQQTTPAVQPVVKMIGGKMYAQRGEPLSWYEALAAQKALRARGIETKLVKETSGTKRLFSPFVPTDTKPAPKQQSALLETGGKLRHQQKRSVLSGNPWDW